MTESRVAENELYRQAASEIGPWDPSLGWSQVEHVERIAERARELMGGAPKGDR